MRALRWLHARLRWRDVVIVALVGASMLFTVGYVRATNREFCAVVSSVTAVRVPPPSDPGGNPSREKQYQLYRQFVSLSHSLGC